jgi:YidC/Oxa1 family membrane protein insertase
MTDIRRTLLWVVFVMSLVLLYDGWNKYNGHPSLLGVPAPTVPTAATAGKTAGVPMAASVPLSASAASLPAAAQATPPDQQVSITTDVYQAQFDSQGGTLIGLKLLKYKETPPHHWYEPLLELVGAAPPVDARAAPVLLFERSGEHDYEAQTGLISAQANADLPNHHTQMTVVPGPRTLAPGADLLTLRFESPVVEGRQLVKTYTFKRGQYVIDVRHEFINQGSAPVTPELYLQLARDGSAPQSSTAFSSTFTGPAMYTDAGHYQKVSFKDIAKDAEKGVADSHEKSADNGWIAMVQHYFASAWLVTPSGPREFRTAKDGNEYTIAMVLPMGRVAPGASKTVDATLFAGPQEEDKLAALAPGLERIKDYGWLYVLSKPLFWLLTQLHKLLGNWGWAIVALVLCLKAAFFWLNASAYRSMAKMKAVAPRVAELKERYKDKPQEMQQQMMRIYREEKVNPLGGCLPIFVQMPFFIALYYVLLASVEMRNAPWLGWIHDLSVPDPYFILPLVMVASSMFQVWLNPAPPDPVQAKMMWIMPLAFGFMFFVFPSGLVIYYVTNNLLSIAQQWFINKRLGVLGK